MPLLNDPLILTILSITLVSLISFIGAITLALTTKTQQAITIYLVSFAAGTLLGDAFLHILPELGSLNTELSTGILILAGILASLILERYLHWQHCHKHTDLAHAHPFAYINLAGDAIHNFIDGVIIASSYLVSTSVGVATTLAVIAHEIPQELGDFAILIHGGFRKGKALLFNFLTATTAFLGAIAALLLTTIAESATPYLLAFAAGNFIYIACTDLIPELHKDACEAKPKQATLAAFLLGIFVMLALKLTLG
ncbi:ZIP family metal transporter [Candidatus Woesearchaeota archaeon]|nr:MAG: ZIP family metal transporter [Candidatus Woesearchaeota archaeon]